MCVNVCMCVNVYLWVLRVYGRMDGWMGECVNGCEYMFVNIRLCLCANVSVCVCMCACLFECVCMSVCNVCE